MQFFYVNIFSFTILVYSQTTTVWAVFQLFLLLPQLVYTQGFDLFYLNGIRFVFVLVCAKLSKSLCDKSTIFTNCNFCFLKIPSLLSCEKVVFDFFLGKNLLILNLVSQRKNDFIAFKCVFIDNNFDQVHNAYDSNGKLCETLTKQRNHLSVYWECISVDGKIID